MLMSSQTSCLVHSVKQTRLIQTEETHQNSNQRTRGQHRKQHFQEGKVPQFIQVLSELESSLLRMVNSQMRSTSLQKSHICDEKISFSGKRSLLKSSIFLIKDKSILQHYVLDLFKINTYIDRAHCVQLCKRTTQLGKIAQKSKLSLQKRSIHLWQMCYCSCNGLRT